MSMFEDMKKACKASASSPPVGRVVITEAHYASAGDGSREAKQERLRIQAADGCCDGTGCGFAVSMIETESKNGTVIETMVTSCSGNPKNVPPI